MKTDTKESALKRLARIEGQVRGIVKMLEENRYCIDVLHQIQAVKSAIRRAESEILKDHANSCISEAIETGDANAQREKISELIDLFERLKR